MVGVVDKLGAGVTNFKVGQTVADLTVFGAYTEYILRPILLCVVPFVERQCSGDISSGPKDVPHHEVHWLDVREYRATLGTEERSLRPLSGIAWQRKNRKLTKKHLDPG